MRTQMTKPKELEKRYELPVYPKRDLLIVRGEGATVWDDKGRAYIDCVGGHGCVNVGHCNPKVIEAIEKQSRVLITCPGVFYNDRRAELLARLAKISGMDHIFLSSSGTESVEAAIKFARASTGRTKILAFMQGFHGRTLGSLSATWKKKYREPFLPLVPDFFHLPFNKTDKIEEGITEDTAAVLVEVIQGEGGVRLATQEFLAGLRTRCDETGTVLIFDEVQTGVGRTGRFFAFEHYGIRPDIICLAKSLAGGVPIGATLCNNKIEIPKNSHGTTFGGNPLSAAAAIAVLDFIEESNLITQAAEKGDYLLKTLKEIVSPKIRGVRGKGLMVGIDLKERSTPYIMRLMDLGILALPAGPTVIRLLPPLVIDIDQIDRVVETLAKVLA